MNKKSFLRGFGIGVLFAAVILGISFSIRTSESATISRAKKLGMVFKSENQKIVLPDPDEVTVSASPAASQAPDATVVPASSVSPSPKVKPSSRPTSSSKETPGSDVKASGKPEVSTGPENSQKPSVNGGNGNTGKNNDNSNNDGFEKAKKKAGKEIEDMKKQLTINDGDWAAKVSDKLEELGVIDNAAEFDKYLEENGYSNIIHSGTYDVSPDDTFEELAEKITSGFN